MHQFSVRRISRSALIASLALAAAICMLAVTAAVRPSAAVEVIGDDEHDRFVGSGAVIMPTSIDASVRWTAATCVGCRWKATMPCLRSDEHSDAACRGFTLGCPQGREISRAWFAQPGRDFEPVGLYCPTDGEVTSVRDFTVAVASEFQRQVPAVDPICQPERGVVVGIPVHCRAGQAPEYRWNDRISGYHVATTARGAWAWRFEANSASAVDRLTRDPGAPYPRPGMQHTFTAPGVHRIDLQARWNGEFTVAGLGPFPIDQGLVQDTSLEVPVGSALGVVRP